MKLFNRKPSFYEEELTRIQEKLKTIDIGDPKYDATMAEMMKLQEFCGKECDRKRFFTKEGRGNIIGKVIGFLGLGTLTVAITKFEKDGNMFSGHSNGLIGSILNLGTHFIKG